MDDLHNLRRRFAALTWMVIGLDVLALVTLGAAVRVNCQLWQLNGQLDVLISHAELK